MLDALLQNKGYMGRSRYKIYVTSLPHFLTMTVVDWLPIFTNPHISEIILESLRYMQREKHAKLYAYVLMENHLHCIIQSDMLSETIKSFKSYTARTIIDYLMGHNNIVWLKKLKHNKLPYKRESDYQLWQEGSHPEEITTEEMMQQKMEYIHNNPVRRGYVDEPCDWRYTSVRNYEGENGLVSIHTEW